MKGFNNIYGKEFVRGKGYKSICEWCGEEFFGRANKKYHADCKVAKQNNDNSIRNNNNLKEISMKKEHVEKVLNHLQASKDKTINAKTVVEVSGVHKFYSNSLLWKMKNEGLLIRQEKGVYAITEKGLQYISNNQPKIVNTPTSTYKDPIEKVQYALTEFIDLIKLKKGHITSAEKMKVISTWNVNGSLFTHAVRMNYFERLSMGIYRSNLKEVTLEQAKELYENRERLTYRKENKRHKFELESKSIKPLKNKAMRNNEKLIGYIQKRKVKKIVNSKMASRILKITPQSANSLLSYMEKQGELVRVKFGVYTLSDKFMAMKPEVENNESKEYAYQKLLKKFNIKVGDLHADIKQGVRQLHQLEKAVTMLSKSGKTATSDTVKRIEAYDEWVCNEIIKYINSLKNEKNESLTAYEQKDYPMNGNGTKDMFYIIEGGRVVAKDTTEKGAYSKARELAEVSKKSHTVTKVLKTVNVEIRITLS
jgi:predicted transcriptional regulator